MRQGGPGDSYIDIDIYRHGICLYMTRYAIYRIPEFVLIITSDWNCYITLHMLAVARLCNQRRRQGGPGPCF